jgi:rRNA-processing protein FCF1
VISAVTGELLKLHDGEGTFRKQQRPLILINAVEKLIAIPDEEFLKYTPQQRADLVEKFAGITGNKDFLTNMPAAFYDKISTLKARPKGNAKRSSN